jgi:hypothetical protein
MGHYTDQRMEGNSMSAAFREAWKWSGVDETTQDGPAMVVPMGGSNFVQLENGADLDVGPKNKKSKRIKITEVGASTQGSLEKVKKEQLTLRSELRFNSGRRTFEIHGLQPAGYRGEEVQAINTREKNKVEAKLRVVVLKPKTVTVSIRPVQVRDSSGKLVHHSKLPFDAKKLIEEMKLILTPQTAIVLSLGLTTPAPVLDEALIAKLLELKTATKAPLPEVVSVDRFKGVFKDLRDPKADVTIFAVQKVGSGLNQDGSAIEQSGTMDSNLKIGFVADNSNHFFYVRTMAHELAHFLGRYRKPDNTYKGFDDLHTDADKLMHQGGSGWKIPLEHCLNYFNAGY